MSKSPKQRIDKNAPAKLSKARGVREERPTRKDLLTYEFIRAMRGSLANCGLPTKLERDPDRVLGSRLKRLW